MTQGELMDLPIRKVRASKTNPRTVFEPKAMAELADSIKTNTLLQRPVVRPLPDGNYEIVAGERRYRAIAEILKWPKIPVVVREMTDLQAASAQLAENLQREGINEREEALAIQRVMKVHGRTADQVAADIGKSRRHVFNRLKLLRMGDVATNAYLAGDLPATHATLVAELDQREQAAALKLIIQDGEAVSVSRTKEILRQVASPVQSIAPAKRERDRSSVLAEAMPEVLKALRTAALTPTNADKVAELAALALLGSVSTEAALELVDALDLAARRTPESARKAIRGYMDGKPGRVRQVLAHLAVRLEAGASPSEWPPSLIEGCRALGVALPRGGSR